MKFIEQITEAGAVKRSTESDLIKQMHQPVGTFWPKEIYVSV